MPKFKFTDSAGNRQDGRRFVFPILGYVDDEVQFIATGFFIAPDIFVTAKHVVFDYKEIVDSLFIVQMNEKGEASQRKVIKIASHKLADVAIGGLEKHNYITNPYLTITKNPLKTGDIIRTFAYPNSKVEYIDDNVAEGTFVGNFYEGKILEYMPNGSAILKNECFMTDMNILSASSGGPVVDKNGRIVGINNSSWTFLEGEGYISYITPINKILEMELPTNQGLISVEKLLHIKK